MRKERRRACRVRRERREKAGGMRITLKRIIEKGEEACASHKRGEEQGRRERADGVHVA